MGHDTVMQGSDFSGVSSSTASAALALTALSAGSEDRKMTEPVVIKHSPPYNPLPPPPPPTNVYQLPGIFYFAQSELFAYVVFRTRV